MRGRKLAQIDPLSGPAWPHRRQWSYDARIRSNRAQRVGVPALRAARVEQQIVKVPKDEVVVALARSQAAVAGIDLEQDAAVQQQREQLEPRKIFLRAQPPDLLRRGQRGDRARKLRIADPEQRSGARRFQHDRVAAPSQVGEPRQHEHVGLAQPRRRRPIVGDLRLDDDRILVACAPQGILQQAVAGQPLPQEAHLLVAAATACRERGERQAGPQLLRALRGARAERSQRDPVAVEAGEDFSVRLRLRGWHGR